MKDFNRSRRAIVYLLFSIVAVASLASAANLPLPTAEATSSITARDLKKHLSFLASDELGGRYTLSPSNRIAARYLASQLESYGYRGAARDHSFLQKVPLSYRKVDQAKSRLVLSAGAGQEQEFAYGDGFLSVAPEDTDLAGDLVFVGYGISSPSHNRDDYAGIDAKGKIVIAVGSAPSSLKAAAIKDEELGQAAAIGHGAVGAIFIPEPQMLLAWEQIKGWLTSQNQLGLPPRKTASGRRLPSTLASPALIKAIARLMGKDSSYLTSPSEKNFKPEAISARVVLKMQ